MAKYKMNLRTKAPKRERNKQVTEVKAVEQFKSFAYTLIGVLAFIGVMALMVFGMQKAGLFEKGYTRPTKEETTIDYEYIAIGTILNREENTYYVLFDNYESNYTNDNYINGLLSKQKNYRVYKVDMSKPENAKYLSKEENKDAKEVNDLKINGITLIKVSNGKIATYVSGIDKIEEYLK